MDSIDVTTNDCPMMVIVTANINNSTTRQWWVVDSESEDEKMVAYKVVRPGVVEITTGTWPPFRVNFRTAEEAIEDIKDRRQSYITQEAYDFALAMYQGAIDALDKAAK